MHSNMEFIKTVKTKPYKTVKEALEGKAGKVIKGKAKHTWQRTDKRNFEVV